MTIDRYWTMSPDELAGRLGVTLDGLSSAAAERRLSEIGANEIHRRAGSSRVRVLWRQVKSPLVLLLVFAAIVSAISGEWVDAAIVAAILGASIGIGYRRESKAETAIAALLDRIQLSADVVRDGRSQAIPMRDVVPGDVILLEPGSIVPADALLIEASELHVDDAALTGESFPTVKRPGPVTSTALRDRTNCVQLGTNVRSGTARALAVATGQRSAYGAIARTLATRAPETEFERGLRKFGMLLLGAMLVMIVVVFALNVLLGRPVADVLLFAISLAVGLSPELLPAIVGVNLSRSAQELAATGVLVRRLEAIENLGSMDVLCTDKTGTLTEGVVRIDGAWDVDGLASRSVLELAVANARLHEGLPNPIDVALIECDCETSGSKVAEVPYDFTRKRLSVIVQTGERRVLITKGAVGRVLEVCTGLDDRRDQLEERARAWAEQGMRVLAVATREVATSDRYTVDDEHDLVFAGFITLADRPKVDAAITLSKLQALGVRVVMITGDSRHVAIHVAGKVGLPARAVVTGEQLDAMSEAALTRVAAATAVYAEVDPNQKSRILQALRRGGSVVGFFGDGVNDAPAMHAADVALSVESAVDVAKATADLVLTSKGLDVIERGIREGRQTFANTMKYILTTTSANLGNMMSMAVASLLLPFLPLTAGQVLLNNFLSDIPAIGIASDRVDPELVGEPRRWDTREIGRFMLEFGLLSSMFDALTFILLIVGFGAGVDEFRTGWFVESLFTELVIALIVRTRRPAWQSAPGTILWTSSLAVAVFAFALPYLPLADFLGFTPPPPGMMLAIVGVTCGYVIASELLKHWFYRAPHALRRPQAVQPDPLARDAHRSFA